MDPNSQPLEEQPEPATPPAPTCRHEFVRIYQRKLKGLERRLVATKAYLPVGFKMTDFGHLSEGSYCFCTKCRARLFPKRTAAEKAAARQAALVKQALAEEAMRATEADDTIENGADLLDAVLAAGVEDDGEKAEESTKSAETSASISVDELEIDALELEEISESSEIEESDEEA
jgi:hypothetical protein